ncbi:MAG TPA: GIY-YIG nuclease family protein [Candidatus Acidoferrales bacterium]|nr:GIY-YIG nuclease family protein [Candidatus Acidoferrales bacterium]
MPYCYILRCADGSFYVGVAEDPVRRCQEHNQRRGAVWTAKRLPVALVWTERHPSLSSARQREIQLKRWSRSKKMALIGVPFDFAQDEPKAFASRGAPAFKASCISYCYIFGGPK